MPLNGETKPRKQTTIVNNQIFQFDQLLGL